jgi:hypothetical protein
VLRGAGVGELVGSDVDEDLRGGAQDDVRQLPPNANR